MLKHLAHYLIGMLRSLCFLFIRPPYSLWSYVTCRDDSSNSHSQVFQQNRRAAQMSGSSRSGTPYGTVCEPLQVPSLRNLLLRHGSRSCRLTAYLTGRTNKREGQGGTVFKRHTWLRFDKAASFPIEWQSILITRWWFPYNPLPLIKTISMARTILELGRVQASGFEAHSTSQPPYNTFSEQP